MHIVFITIPFTHEKKQVIQVKKNSVPLNAHLFLLNLYIYNPYSTYLDCLVHGPLTATLLLSLFQKHLGHTHTLLDFTYRALSPLYVNRPLTLHGKVLDVKRRKGGDTDSLKLGEEEESMLCELWCTNEEGGLAMKGTATMVPNK